MDWKNILYSLPGIILGLTLHEFCHALAAYKLGDRTAKDQGRLTFNPIKHIDPIGFVFIIIAGFGWAKPVQFNPDNLKHYRRDKAIIAAAGPLSNFMFGIILLLIIKIIFALTDYSIETENWDMYIFMTSGAVSTALVIVLQAAIINLGLFIFNLIPLPPLDGSHIAFSGLNLRPETEHQIMRIGTPLLFLIIIVQNWTHITIIPISGAIGAIIGVLIPELRGII